jgi:hypothetical protein
LDAAINYTHGNSSRRLQDRLIKPEIFYQLRENTQTCESDREATLSFFFIYCRFMLLEPESPHAGWVRSAR